MSAVLRNNMHEEDSQSDSEESGEDNESQSENNCESDDEGDASTEVEEDDSEDGAGENSNEHEIEGFLPGMKEFSGKLSGSDGEGEVCPICLNHFVGQELGSPENCNHTFCLECILEWSKNLNSCPLDRKEFDEILVKLQPLGDVLRKIEIEMRSKVAEAALPEDTTACEVCNRGDREDRLLLCDSCDLAYHCECLDPPLWSIPIVEWFCPTCSAVLNRNSRRPVTANFQRVIPRTIISETVRTRIQSQRTTVQGSSVSSASTLINNPSTSRSKVTSKPRRRRTYRRRRRVTTKKTVLARTKKTAGLGKGKMQSRVVVTTSIRRRRRRKYRRKSKKAKAVITTRKSRFASRPLAAPTAKGRIASHLGLCKPPPGHTIPSVKQLSSKGKENVNSTSSLSLFGNHNQLMDFDDDCVLNADIAGPSSSPRKLVHKPIHHPQTPVDLLSHILSAQDLLRKPSKDISIGWDGSLTLKKTAAKSKSETFQTSSAVLIPFPIERKLPSHHPNTIKENVDAKVEDKENDKKPCNISAATFSDVQMESEQVMHIDVQANLINNTNASNIFMTQRQSVKSERNISQTTYINNKSRKGEDSKKANFPITDPRSSNEYGNDYESTGRREYIKSINAIRLRTDTCFSTEMLEQQTNVKRIKTRASGEINPEILTDIGLVKSEHFDCEPKNMTIKHKKEEFDLSDKLEIASYVKSEESERTINGTACHNNLYIKAEIDTVSKHELDRQIPSRFKQNQETVVKNVNNGEKSSVNLECLSDTTSVELKNLSKIRNENYEPFETKVVIPSEYQNRNPNRNTDKVDVGANVANRSYLGFKRNASNIDDITKKDIGFIINPSELKDNRITVERKTHDIRNEPKHSDLDGQRIASDDPLFNDDLTSEYHSCHGSSSVVHNVIIKKSEEPDDDWCRKRTRCRQSEIHNNEPLYRKKRLRNSDDNKTTPQSLLHAIGNDLHSQINNFNSESPSLSNLKNVSSNGETSNQWNSNNIVRDEINRSYANPNYKNCNQDNTDSANNNTGIPSIDVNDRKHEETVCHTVPDRFENDSIQKTEPFKCKTFISPDVEILAVKVKKSIYLTDSSACDLLADVKIIGEVKHVMEQCSDSKPETARLAENDHAIQNMEVISKHDEIRKNIYKSMKEKNGSSLPSKNTCILNSSRILYSQHDDGRELNTDQSEVTHVLKTDGDFYNQHVLSSKIKSDAEEIINVKKEQDCSNLFKSAVDIKVKKGIVANENINLEDMKHAQIKSEIVDDFTCAHNPNSQIKLEVGKKVSTDMCTSNFTITLDVKNENSFQRDCPSPDSSSFSVLSTPPVIYPDLFIKQENRVQSHKSDSNVRWKGKRNIIQPLLSCEVKLKSHKESSQKNIHVYNNLIKGKLLNVEKEQQFPKRHKSASEAKTQNHMKEMGPKKKHDLFFQVESVVKKILKPFFLDRSISKENYKDIMRKSIPKILKNSDNGIIDTAKVKKLIFQYVDIFTKQSNPS